MSSRSCFVIVFILGAMFLSTLSYAGWKKIAVVPLAEGEVHCGFFFDDMNGFVGTGSWGGAAGFFIRRTTDGGKTWTLCTTPVGKGLVTNIFMKDLLIGYASVALDAPPLYSLLKTTDGGLTWSDDTHGNKIITTSVYATSKALIRTEWENNEEGAFSLDDGLTFSGISQDTNTYGNGIDFASDKAGVIVYRSSDTRNLFPSWSTQDGGLTWTKSLDSIPEAWSVYGLKGTETFLMLPEGQLSDPSNIVYWSQNGGLNWQVRAIMPDADYTGHIAGVANTIYVQARGGFYRSDDIGLTWKFVGGPGNDRDTRFVVTGCKGQVVYAFDNGGYIYKTTDGGDGTLLASGGGTILALSEDSIMMESHFCQPAKNYFHLSNALCDPLIIDSIIISPDPYNEFSIDTVSKGITLSPSDNGYGIPVVFTSDSDVTRQTFIRISAHSGGQKLDTTIFLSARQALAPDPYVGLPSRAKVGGKVLVPIYLHPTPDSFRITHYAFHLSYDGDVLTPSVSPFSVTGTLSANAIVEMKSKTANGSLYDVDFVTPISGASDLTIPLVYIEMNVTLSSHLFSAISLDSFSFTGGNQPLALLQMCLVPEAEFLVDQECGDTSISSFLLTDKIPGLISVHPNPSTGNSIEAEIYLPEESDLDLEIISASGKSSQKVFERQHFTNGNHAIPINTSSLPSGTYILRMTTAGGSVVNQEIIIQR